MFEISRHAIKLTTVEENRFFHAAELFQLNQQKEKVILDSMVADIRYTANALKDQVPELSNIVKGGFFDGKTVFEAMVTTGRKELEEFLKYIVARPGICAGNTWKLSEIFATWIVSKSPQAITN